MKKINNDLKEYFKKAGIKQQAVADAIGVKKSFISELLSEKRNVGYETAVKLSKAYGFNLEWLLTGEGTMLRDVSVVDGKGNQVAQNVSGGKVEQTQVNGGVGEEYLKEVIEEQKTIIEQLQKQVAEQGATIQRLVDKM